MAEDCWNKIYIPIPSAVSSSRIPFTDSVDVLVECLLTDCEKVLSLLLSQILQTEIRVLYELLYVLNNGFRQHKPFRALKQVEQCINRLKEMKLQAAIEDLKELCPNKFQRDAGAEAGDCDVPSQPMLEWLCLKLLGASSLLARTLERCTHAFILSRQHLHLGEFVVLNVVITSMISRLWVFFRGILRALIPMYKRSTELLQMVSQSQPMPYLTNFTLPVDLKDFLCLSYPDLLINEATKNTSVDTRGTKRSKLSLLSRLFGEKGQVDDSEEDERKLMPILAASHHEGSSLDLGAAVLQQRPDITPYGIDLKVMLQQTCKTAKQMSLEPQTRLDSSSPAAVSQKRKFLKSLRKVPSFRDMAAHLKEAMDWCRSLKFHQERKHLAFLSLRCLRMEYLEAEGIRVEKRLKKFKLQVQKVLMLKKTFPPKFYHSVLRRTRGLNRSFREHYSTFRRRSAISRMTHRIVKDVSVLSKHKKNCDLQQTSKEEVSEKNVVPEKISQTVLQKPNTPKDDIDDIFESFGF